MNRLVMVILSLALLNACAPAQTGLRLVDDSYTIAQRYEGYKDTYPGLTWPAVSFQEGQQILFDRLYKTAGAHDLHMDIFLPTPVTDRHQGIVLVHGGAWRSGSKSHFYALATVLAQRGYVVFLPEYRLAPESAYPAGLIDINDAIVWVKTHASDFGLKGDHLALGGASSGGQMAALLAYTAQQPEFKTHASDDTHVNALIDLDGVLDFTSPLALKYENAAGSRSPGALWLGGSFEQKPETWRQASAVAHVDAQSPPTLIISSGNLRFTAGREDVIAALGRLGVRSGAFTFENAPHDIWLFEPYLSQIVDKVDLFLRDDQ